MVQAYPFAVCGPFFSTGGRCFLACLFPHQAFTRCKEGYSRIHRVKRMSGDQNFVPNRVEAVTPPKTDFVFVRPAAVNTNCAS